jgi:hypothetical protein
MRADTQRKPLGFQAVTASHYRCVSFCVTRLTRSQDVIPHSLVFETKGFLEQPSNTLLLQTVFIHKFTALLLATYKTLLRSS